MSWLCKIYLKIKSWFVKKPPQDNIVLNNRRYYTDMDERNEFHSDDAKHGLH